MAHITLEATLGKDIELRWTPDGKPIAKTSAAWTENHKHNGTWTQGPTVWLQITIFGTQAENAAASLHKGDRVTLTGRIKQETWDSTNGSNDVFTLTADTIAPSLRFATTTSTKTPTGTTPHTTPNNPDTDPWEPTNTEPPF